MSAESADPDDTPEAAASLQAPPAPASSTPARRSPSRVLWVGGGILSALVLLGGLGVALFEFTHQKGDIVLPAKLLGLSKYSGPGELATQRALEKQILTGSKGTGATSVAAFYGEWNISGFWVVGTTCPGACMLVPTAGGLVQDALAAGAIDARSFPAGPDGGVLVCTSQKAARGDEYIACHWEDRTYSGTVYFSNSYASSLRQAAADTLQIRASVEP